MLIDVLAVMKSIKWKGLIFYDVQLQRLIRYADQQEKDDISGRDLSCIRKINGLSFWGFFRY